MAVSALAQRVDPNDPKNVERGRELINLAIKARGGQKYLGFNSIYTSGQYTPFEKGLSQIPTPFEDWIVYPDKERTEFGKGKKKNRRIQVNTGNTGWVYDGDAETLKDQTDAQIKSHMEGMEFDIDRILRVSWKEPGAEVRFFGREEIRPGERADVIAIRLNADQTVFLWLDRQTYLPMSLIYERSGENGLTKNEVRYFQYVEYDGVKFPNIVDFYRDGVQASRVNYQTVKIGLPVGEELFVKPASVKAIK
jgi:hypothetical protein